MIQSMTQDSKWFFLFTFIHKCYGVFEQLACSHVIITEVSIQFMLFSHKVTPLMFPLGFKLVPLITLNRPSTESQRKLPHSS